MKRMQVLLAVFSILAIFATGCAPAATPTATQPPAPAANTSAPATQPPAAASTSVPATQPPAQQTAAAQVAQQTMAAAAAALPHPTDDPNAKFKFGMVTDQAGLGDQGFNDMAWTGMVQSAKDFNGNIKVLESVEPANYVPNFTAFADQKYDLIVGVGFLLTDAINEVAPQYPNLHFVLVDATSTAPNVASVITRDQEGAYVAGAIAGMMTKTGKVGYIAGVSSDEMNKFQFGYQAGVKTTNPKAAVLVAYVGSFADPAKAKDLANAQYAQGADIIYAPAGLGETGVIAAAKANNGYEISTDLDKSYLAPNNVIAGVIKRVDTEVYTEAKAVANGTFKGGVVSVGIAQGTDLLSPQTQKMCPPKVLQVATDLQNMIIAGTVVPPLTEAQFNSFTPPTVNWP